MAHVVAKYREDFFSEGREVFSLSGEEISFGMKLLGS